MNIGKLWAMILVTSAFGAVVARDIPPGPDLEVDDIMIAEEENVMDYWNYTAKLNTNRMGGTALGNVQCDFNGQNLPHPEGCSKFVQCSWSTPIEQPCPLGTVWLQSKLTCVHIPNTNCDQIALVSPSSPANCSCGITKLSNRIIGGIEVNPPRKYPWQVGLIGKDRPNLAFFCGGSIINNKFVLTAAHCVYNKYYNPNENLYVQIGEHDQSNPIDDYLNGDFLIFAVKTIIIHPCYNCKTTDNDFALLELEDPIDFKDVIRPVCLPDDDSETYTGDEATVAGWGDTMFEGSISLVLLELDVTILGNNKCGLLWDSVKKITPNMMCAEDPNTWKKNICHGDSGSPLVVKDQKSRYVQVGVASFVGGNEDDDTGHITACNVKDSPGVYSRVSKVLDWIKAKSASGQYCDN